MKTSKSTTLQQALRIANSPFADFHMELRGYDITNARTGKVYMKWMIWNAYKDRPDELRRIRLRKHPSYVFIKNENLNFKPSK